MRSVIAVLIAFIAGVLLGVAMMSIVIPGASNWIASLDTIARWQWTGVIALGILLVSIIIFVPEAYVSHKNHHEKIESAKDKLTLINEVRTTTATIIGSVIVLAGAYHGTMEYRTNLDRQYTDRFSKAIEQLGSDKLPVRMGGIHALERIAQDSPRDFAAVMDILATFVRDNAPCEFADGSPNTSTYPPEDIQAALRVIIYRDTAVEPPDSLGPNFEQAMLKTADLGEGKLARANFSAADLTYAWLCEADLFGATFTLTTLKNANLDGVDLTEATFNGAHLEGANFTGATGLTPEQLASSFWDESTIFPDYLDLSELKPERIKKLEGKQQPPPATPDARPGQPPAQTGDGAESAAN